MNTYGYVGGNPVNFFDSLGLYPECDSTIMDVFNLTSSRSEKELISRNYGFSFVLRDPSVGPNLDPRRPRQPPVSPGVTTEVWWALKEMYLVKIFETIKTYQKLKVFCTEQLTDECGNVSEFRTNFDRTELVDENERLVSETIESHDELIRLLLAF